MKETAKIRWEIEYSGNSLPLHLQPRVLPEQFLHLYMKFYAYITPFIFTLSSW